MQRQPRYSKEEIIRRGEELFRQKICQYVSDEDPEKFVAIDIESGEFEVDSDSHAATERLIARIPDSQIFMRRVGHPSTYRFSMVPRRSDRPILRKVTR